MSAGEQLPPAPPAGPPAGSVTVPNQAALLDLVRRAGDELAGAHEQPGADPARIVGAVIAALGRCGAMVVLLPEVER